MPGKAEDAGGLPPGKDDNAAWRNPAPQIMLFFDVADY